MRTYDVTVKTRRRGSIHWVTIGEYTLETTLNIRAALIWFYQYVFKKAPRMHWAESGDLCMGQAWNRKYGSGAEREVKIFQHNLMHTAYTEAANIIWNAKLPRLAERRAA